MNDIYPVIKAVCKSECHKWSNKIREKNRDIESKISTKRHQGVGCFIFRRPIFKSQTPHRPLSNSWCMSPNTKQKLHEKEICLKHYQ